MGGLVCWARRSAILQFETVPTDTKQIQRFDEQMRALYAAPGIAESLVSDVADRMTDVCNILGKTSWSTKDREDLLEIIESLYEQNP